MPAKSNDRRPDENSDRKGISGVDKYGEINGPILRSLSTTTMAGQNQALHRIMIVRYQDADNAREQVPRKDLCACFLQIRHPCG
jgi:hypothetical protein